MANRNLRILELYSGIGGMHYACKAAELAGEVIAAIDINTVANTVYKHNFPSVNLMNRDIKSLSINELKSMSIEVILMSPPCQPFTRNGNCLDKNDERTLSFLHLLKLIKELESLEFILMENVKGFEISKSRDDFLMALNECNFDYKEYLISPTHFGIPNSRLRYYCLARRKPFPNTFNKEIVTDLPKLFEKCSTLGKYIQPEEEVLNNYYLTDKFLSKGKILDIVNSEAKHSCCFTKAYTRYLEGTGSVFTQSSNAEIDNVRSSAQQLQSDSELIELYSNLKLRFFTPEEVKGIMAFPKTFSFPDSLTDRQKYRLLGNSVNVKVVSELLKILLF